MISYKGIQRKGCPYSVFKGVFVFFDKVYSVVFNSEIFNKDLYNYVSEFVDKFYFHKKFDDLVDGKTYCGISVLNKKIYDNLNYGRLVSFCSTKAYVDIFNGSIFYVDKDLFVYYVIHFLYDSDYTVSVIDFNKKGDDVEIIDSMIFNKEYYSNLTEDDFEYIDEYIFKV